jgi:hypothetical protein
MMLAAHPVDPPSRAASITRFGQDAAAGPRSTPSDPAMSLAIAADLPIDYGQE